MDKGDLIVREKIIVHNIRLVFFEISTKFKFANYDKKDLIFIGNLGLIKTVNTFGISKNISFMTYAIKCPK